MDMIPNHRRVMFLVHARFLKITKKLDFGLPSYRTPSALVGE